MATINYNKDNDKFYCDAHKSTVLESDPKMKGKFDLVEKEAGDVCFICSLSKPAKQSKPAKPATKTATATAKPAKQASKQATTKTRNAGQVVSMVQKASALLAQSTADTLGTTAMIRGSERYNSKKSNKVQTLRKKIEETQTKIQDQRTVNELLEQNNKQAAELAELRAMFEELKAKK